jgi:hypothetical protein
MWSSPDVVDLFLIMEGTALEPISLFEPSSHTLPSA